MSVDKETILGKLPPYIGKRELIHPNQRVGDIITEVLDAHQVFASDYDNIALCFDQDSVNDICKALYSFCKKNFVYDEQNEDNQQTMSPAAMLHLKVDCKNFAGFIGGVLDGLNRLTDRKVNWCYRFASYDIFDSTPHHVFVVVSPGKNEIWLDPTPGSSQKAPTWQMDKKIKISSMALHRVSGIGISNKIGISSLTVTPLINSNPGQIDDNNINFDGTNKYRGVFKPYLGLSMYRDLGGDRNINENWVADQINKEIAKGPFPGHTVTGDFIKWVYNANIRSWNFYYPGGVKPGFTAIDLLPINYPRLILTQDGRLTFDKDVKIDDWRNAEIHLLTAWTQAMINEHDASPYPVKPEHLKVFSQLKEGNVNTRNLLTEARGDSFIKEVGKAIEDGVNFVKEGVLKVVGFIPRNAFLSLVGLNVFHMANDLTDSINAGKWDKIANTWKDLGGNPDKLLNTIDKGNKQQPILDVNKQVEETIGAVQVAAILAAAAPIIAAMLAFLNKDGKLNPAIQATKVALQAAYPDENFDFIDGALTQNGMPVTYTTDAQYNENSPLYNPNATPATDLLRNPIVLALAGGIGTYFIVNKRGKKVDFLIPVAVSAVIYLIMSRQGNLIGRFGSGTIYDQVPEILLPPPLEIVPYYETPVMEERTYM